MQVLDGNSVARMDLETIVGKVHNLSDLELATLLCLIAKQHCLIETEEDFVDDVAQELALVGHGHLERDVLELIVSTRLQMTPSTCRTLCYLSMIMSRARSSAMLSSTNAPAAWAASMSLQKLRATW